LPVKRNDGNKGIGLWLLIDALQKLLSASDTLGFTMIIVDVKKGMKYFYEQFGFRKFVDKRNRMFLSVADVHASFYTRN